MHRRMQHDYLTRLPHACRRLFSRLMVILNPFLFPCATGSASRSECSYKEWPWVSARLTLLPKVRTWNALSTRSCNGVTRGDRPGWHPLTTKTALLKNRNFWFRMSYRNSWTEIKLKSNIFVSGLFQSRLKFLFHFYLRASYVWIKMLKPRGERR